MTAAFRVTAGDRSIYVRCARRERDCRVDGPSSIGLKVDLRRLQGKRWHWSRFPGVKQNIFLCRQIDSSARQQNSSQPADVTPNVILATEGKACGESLNDEHTARSPERMRIPIAKNCSHSRLSRSSQPRPRNQRWSKN